MINQNSTNSNSEIVLNNMNFEAKSNLLGFFNLLLKIDRRNNPHLYKNKSNDYEQKNDKQVIFSN